MSAGLFVTGTGTEVGKSVVAAVLAAGARRQGRTVAVFKPAVSGLERGGESDHELLRRASGSTQSDEQIAPYRYGPPLSPHLAGELAGKPVDPARALRGARAAAAGAEVCICEGVGGLLVPLTAGYLIRDLALDLGYPLVVVAEAGLGTINHTLLTLEAARAVGLEPAAVVLNRWPAEPGALERSNRETIARLGSVAVETLAELELGDPGGWPALPIEPRTPG